MKKICLETTVALEGLRIDKAISTECPDMSRSFIQKHIKDGQCFVNEKVVKASYILNAGDLVELTVPDAIMPDILAEDIPLSILYEDDDLLIVNKPKDMVVHPASGHYSGTLVNAIMYHCKDQLSGINGVMRPGIVHRIDKDTTGSLIVCKNDFTHNHIAEQLKEHSIDRRYLAIVYGVIKDDKGTINAPIGRDEKDRLRMSINHKNGKEAITHYTVLKRFEKYTYIECKLETGRTHQIRVHMASIGHPLLGDELYQCPKTPFKLKGQTLHAMHLGLIHPRTGELIEIDAPLPDYFSHLLEAVL